MKKLLSVVVVYVLLGVSACPSPAGTWTVTNLHPAGIPNSYAWGISGDQQAGFAEFNGYSHAGMWNGAAASWVDLNPTGAADSRAWSVSDNQQVGYASINGYSYAGMWSGSAASWVNLNPCWGIWFSRLWRFR